jgi:hypothetical protein
MANAEAAVVADPADDDIVFPELKAAYAAKNEKWLI